jgi:pimeloyl-ACP methyl ester carboxylesterase
MSSGDSSVGAGAGAQPYRPLVPMRTEWHEVRGLRHRVLRWGPPSTAPIVLLHGFQDTGETWQLLVDALPRDWSFAAPDLRGFGDTAANAAPYWFPDYLADLDVLLDLLAPDAPVRMMGHSMGGNVAALYAGVRPARLRWLVSLEGFGMQRVAPARAPERYARWLDELRAGVRHSTYESIDVLAGILQRRNPRLAPAVAAFVARAWSKPSPAAGTPGAVELRHDPWHRIVNPVLSRREEAEACWQRITAPVLLLVGTESEYRPYLKEDGSDAALRASFPTATLATIAQAGHMLHHERAAEVAARVLRWLPDTHRDA